MNEAATAPRTSWSDTLRVVDLLAVSPCSLGGVVLRSKPGPERDRVCAWLRDRLPAASPLLRLPLHVTEDRLLGGLCLSATLRTGRTISERGILEAADGGVLIVAMAERLEAGVTSHLCAALDRRAVVVERDGVAGVVTCRVAVVALDEGLDEDRTPASLLDRLAFHVDVAERAMPEQDDDDARSRIAEACALLPSVAIDNEVVEALARAAVALGIVSLRAPILASSAARAHAALEGRTLVGTADAEVAARLVLGPRATQFPVSPEDVSEDVPLEESGPESPHEAPREREDDGAEKREPPAGEPRPLDEILLDAAKCGVPSGLLETFVQGREARAPSRSPAGAGAQRITLESGRPIGTRSGAPVGGARLNLVATLRAAAPWQPLRRREARVACSPRVEIRKQDFRVSRFQRRTETSVIFSVDASGSAAMQRLAEAKGAVEQILSDCYSRRDQVALVAFRASEATLIVPPTRSLVRARRALANLAGGGATPVAAGIDAAMTLAMEARKRGRTPILVFMSDGRANVARDGRKGGAAGSSDALESARAVRAAGIRVLFLDTAPRPRTQARMLAAELGARYLPLPYLDAPGISAEVASLGEGAV